MEQGNSLPHTGTVPSIYLGPTGFPWVARPLIFWDVASKCVAFGAEWVGMVELAAKPACGSLTAWSSWPFPLFLQLLHEQQVHPKSSWNGDCRMEHNYKKPCAAAVVDRMAWVVGLEELGLPLLTAAAPEP